MWLFSKKESAKDSLDLQCSPCTRCKSWNLKMLYMSLKEGGGYHMKCRGEMSVKVYGKNCGYVHFKRWSHGYFVAHYLCYYFHNNHSQHCKLILIIQTIHMHILSGQRITNYILAIWKRWLSECSSRLWRSDKVDIALSFVFLYFSVVMELKHL